MLSNLMNKLDDMVNPIVVKEIRQSINSNSILFTVTLVLLAELVMLFAFMIGSEFKKGMGHSFFLLLIAVVTGATFFCVGLVSASRFAKEREKDSMDLIYTTVISPYSIIWGKLFSAMVMVMFIFSLCVPFMCVSYFLKGIDILTILFWSYVAFVTAIPLVMATISLGAFAVNKGARTLVSIGVVVVFFTFISSTGVFRHTRSLFPGSTSVYDLTILFYVTLACIAVSGLLYFLSIAVVSHITSNRTFALRIYLVGLWLGLLILAISLMLYYGKGDPIIIWYGPSMIIGIAIIAFSSMERFNQTRRVIKEVPARAYKRILHFFCSSGVANAVAFGVTMIIVNNLLLLAIVKITDKYWSRISTSDMDAMIIINGIAAYTLFYTCLAISVKRVLHRFFPLINGFVYFLFIGAGFTIIPALIGALLSLKMGTYSGGYGRYLFILSPAIFDYGDLKFFGLWASLITAGLGVIINLRFFVRKFREHKNLQPQSSKSLPEYTVDEQ